VVSVREPPNPGFPPLTLPQGFIGRHLALYIHENNLASEVRLVDKVLPQLAWLAPEFQEACSKEKFVQADASRERRWCPILPDA
jgi:nucleoside-diphosphate-sugar epimerase